MKAMVRDSYGGPEVLSVEDIERPEPGPDGVLIQVRAAAVDQGTWHLLAGKPYIARLALGLRRPRARTSGMDVAGVIESVGANVTGFAPGDEVFGSADGSLAEFVAAKPKKLVHKPANISFEQAGAVAVSGCTAMTATRDIEAGQRVLVIGAGGGVGSYAVQLAKVAGAHVTAMCGPTKDALVRELGADDVIDYTKSGITGQYDLIIDIAGNRRTSLLRKALTARGTLRMIGGEVGGPWFGGIGRGYRAMMLSPFVKHRLRAPISLVNPADLTRLRELLESGQITAAVDRVLPLADLPAAIADLREGRVKGKLVLTP